MLFTLDFEKKGPSTIFIVANSLEEAFSKFKASELSTKKEYQVIQDMNDFNFTGRELIDIHETSPMLIGYRIFPPKDSKKIKDEDPEGLIIADSIEQVIKYFKDKVNLAGVWRVTRKDEIVLP